MSGSRQAVKSGRVCFPRTARLTNPFEFKRVFKENISSSDRYFRVLGRSNDAQCSRLGMAVSRQVDKRAVGRNRIKRIIRESFRHFFDHSAATADSGPNPTDGSRMKQSFVDLVVLPRRECVTICNKQLFHSLELHWTRISESLLENSSTENNGRG
jgi:ribonuclease P protein component